MKTFDLLRMAGKFPLGRNRYAQLFFTRDCNYQCPYCSSKDQAKADLSLEEWEEIIHWLCRQEVDAVSITGGEPTIRDDLEDFVDMLTSHHRVVSLNTNGSLINEQRIDDLKKAGLDALVVSCDGYGYKSDPQLEVLMTAKDRRIVPSAITILTPQNTSLVPQLADLYTANGIFYAVALPQTVGGMFSEETQVVFDERELQSVFDYLTTLKKKTSLIRTSFPYLQNQSSRWKCDPEKTRWVTINNDGRLMVCQEFASPFLATELDSLGEGRWLNFKRQTSDRCSGCYYGCYYEHEEVNGLKPLRELPVLLQAARMRI